MLNSIYFETIFILDVAIGIVYHLEKLNHETSMCVVVF